MTRMSVVVAAALLLSSAATVAQAPTTPVEPAAAPTADPADAAPAKPAKKLSYTDDYKITVNHDADSDGEIVFRVVTKKEGTSQEIRAAIKKGASENSVADAIKAAFKAQLGTKQYNIEGEDGESVVIEGSGGKEYSLVLVSNTVAGVSVKIGHD